MSNIFKNWDAGKVAEHNARIRNGKNNNHRASGGSDLEPSVVDESERQDAPQVYLPRVDIRITNYRRRLTDADAACCKWFVDGLVKAKILRDDSPKEVREVSYRQEKIEQWDIERMTVELVEVIK